MHALGITKYRDRCMQEGSMYRVPWPHCSTRKLTTTNLLYFLVLRSMNFTTHQVNSSAVLELTSYKELGCLSNGLCNGPSISDIFWPCWKVLSWQTILQCLICTDFSAVVALCPFHPLCPLSFLTSLSTLSPEHSLSFSSFLSLWPSLSLRRINTWLPSTTP